MAESEPVEVEGRVAKQVGGCGYFALVRACVTPENSVSVKAEPSTLDDYDRGQGWLEAAEYGVPLGMELAAKTGCCKLIRVRGMTCDTSPALVAIAAMRAVWTATGFEPSIELAERAEECVLAGHRLSLDQLADRLRETAVLLPLPPQPHVATSP